MINKRKTRPVVAVDLDGVVLDFKASWQECASWTCHKKIAKVSDDYDLALRFGMSALEHQNTWRAFHADWWDRVEPYPETFEWIHTLERAGTTIIGITNVDARHQISRARSLCGIIPEGRIFCLGHNASSTIRANILRKLNAKAYIDDLPTNANAAYPVVPVTVLLNRNYANIEQPQAGITIVDDAHDFLEVASAVLSLYSETTNQRHEGAPERKTHQGSFGSPVHTA
ncbi:hypothetical protein JKG47_00375 [Acidithiobacillus sp. MC6.1]|nr:hypothetical protein [Acidithiobacillus sp. MC6.1]